MREELIMRVRERKGISGRTLWLWQFYERNLFWKIHKLGKAKKKTSFRKPTPYTVQIIKEGVEDIKPTTTI